MGQAWAAQHPGSDAHLLVRCVERPAGADRAGRPGRRVRVGGPQEPPDAHRRVPRAGARDGVRLQPPGHRGARRRTRPASTPAMTSPRPACASWPPVTTCPSPGTRSRSSTTSRRSRTRPPAMPRRSTPTSCPGRTTSRQCWPRSSWARATRASCTSRMRRPTDGVTAIDDPGRGQRPRDVRRGGVGSTTAPGRRRQPSSTTSPARRPRRSWPSSGSCHRQ